MIGYSFNGNGDWLKQALFCVYKWRTCEGTDDGSLLVCVLYVLIICISGTMDQYEYKNLFILKKKKEKKVL